MKVFVNKVGLGKAEELLQAYLNGCHKEPIEFIYEEEAKYTASDLEYFFLEARKTHPMLGYKHKDFRECFDWFTKYGTEA